ncbi:MAG TPA: WD40 repeat domain-containing protein [Gemmataceae bacterium]|nr:WD40 repeat domain-containing protein [Gemmataceae bacterium]
MTHPLRFAAALSILLVGAAARAGEPSAVLARLGSDRFRHPSTIWAVTYSPDGKHLAAADEEGIRIWDAADGRRVRFIPIKDLQVDALHYAPDGRTLYATAQDGNHATRLCRIDPTTGKVRSNVPLRRGITWSAFSPDGAYLALRHNGRAVLHVVNLGTGTDWTDNIGNDRVESFAFRPDGKALAVGTHEGRILTYDPRSGKVLREHRLDTGEVRDLTFCPDNTDLIVVSFTQERWRLARFDVATGKVRWMCETRRATNPRVTADGRAVIYRGSDRDAKYPDHWHWVDIATGKPTGVVFDVGNPNAGPNADVYHEALAYAVAWRPDGAAFALSGHDGLIAQWDVVHRRRLPASADPPGPVTELHTTADGTKVRGWVRGWYEWNLKTGRQVNLTPDLALAPQDVFAVSRDLKWLAKANPGRPAVEIIDLASRQRKHLLEDVPEGVYPYFLRDGRLVIALADALHLYDPATGTRLVKISFPTGKEGTCQITADGASVGRLARDKTRMQISRWSLETGKVISTWAGELPEFGDRTREVGSGAWLSPDGRVAAFRSLYTVAPNVTEEQNVLVESVTGRKIRDWIGSRSDSMTFSPDGRSLLEYSLRPFSYFVREVATGEHRAQVNYHRPVTGFTFGPAARTVIVSTKGYPVEVWDAIGDAGPWEPAKADRLWDTLARSDTQAAYAAIRNLLAHPAEAGAFLKARVKVPAPLAAEWLAERLKTLDAPAFRDREKATADLAAAGELAIAPLRSALSTASAEARARFQGVLSKVEGLTPEKLRAIRVCEVAEGLGTTDARELLAAWATGPAGTTLTREAAESVARLKGLPR